MPRKQHTYHYIYKTTCKVTGKYYVGMHSTSNLEDDYIGSGKRLWYSIKKHGRDNHQKEILEFPSDRKSLKERERELVNDSLIQDPMCMNIMKGGEGGRGFDKGTNKGSVTVKDEFGNFFKVKKDDSRYLSGELIPFTKGEVVVKDSSGKKFRVSKDDPRYLSGEFVGANKGIKLKLDKRNDPNHSSHFSQTGSKNSQYGTCWIHSKDGKNKKVKKEEIEIWLKEGWFKGAKFKKLPIHRGEI